jgi:single-stranded DNA-binding protein
MNFPQPPLAQQSQQAPVQQQAQTPAGPSTRLIFGNLVKDPEFRIVQQTQGGESPVCKITVAMEGRDSTSTFYDCSIWGNTAYYVAYLKKMDKVTVVGRYEQRTYQKNDGTQGVSNELKFASVQIGLEVLPL